MSPVEFPVEDLDINVCIRSNASQSLRNIWSISAHGFRIILDNLCIRLGVKLLLMFVAIFNQHKWI